MNKRALILLFSLWALPFLSLAECSGRFTDPIGDICWNCMFPLSIGDMNVVKGPDNDADPSNPKDPVCFCIDNGTPPLPQFGLTLGFWEPARLVELTHTPFCFPSLGGTEMDMGIDIGQGSQKVHEAPVSSSMYQAHWYVYLPLYWLEIILYMTCIEKGDFDLAYLSEFDPTWQDDTLALWLTPETALFANPVAQSSCAADCSAASANLPMDSLYWCGGCQGSLYPFSGHVSRHIGGVQASTLLAQRFTAKLHRQGLLPGTMGRDALCETYPMPTMQKTQYKAQMTYPKANTRGKYAANPYGRSTTFWEAGREYSITGEDFAYLIWRKRNCCAF